MNPRVITLDPNHLGGYWVGDDVSVRYCDGKSIELVAGQETAGFHEGAKTDAQFDGVMGMVYRSQTRQLIVSDWANHRIRTVDPVSGQTVTIVGDGECCDRPGNGRNCSIVRLSDIVFDRSSPNESVIFFGDPEKIHCFDLITTEHQLLDIRHRQKGIYEVRPNGLYCLSDGNLIMGCSMTQSVYHVSVSSGEIEFLAGSKYGGRTERCYDDDSYFNHPCAVVANECDNLIYIADRDRNRIVTIPLPTPSALAAKATLKH